MTAGTHLKEKTQEEIAALLQEDPVILAKAEKLAVLQAKWDSLQAYIKEAEASSEYITSFYAARQLAAEQAAELAESKLAALRESLYPRPVLATATERSAALGQEAEEMCLQTTKILESIPPATNEVILGAVLPMLVHLDTMNALSEAAVTPKVLQQKEALVRSLNVLGVYEYMMEVGSELDDELLSHVLIAEHLEGVGPLIVLQTLYPGYQLELPGALYPFPLRKATIRSGHAADPNPAPAPAPVVEGESAFLEEPPSPSPA